MNELFYKVTLIKPFTKTKPYSVTEAETYNFNEIDIAHSREKAIKFFKSKVNEADSKFEAYVNLVYDGTDFPILVTEGKEIKEMNNSKEKSAIERFQQNKLK